MVKGVAFILGAISFGLGTWHLENLQKTGQDKDVGLPAESTCNEIVSSSRCSDSPEFQKVQCKGTFDKKKSIYVGPRSKSISGVIENGYCVITPFIPVLGDPQSIQTPILVNRGWVPRSWRDKALDASEDEPQPSSSSPSMQERPKSSWWRF